MLELDRLVRDLARRHTAWVDAQLAALNPGETLCVHEDHGDWDARRDRITVRAYAHVLEPGETCDMPERRQQYGPAPADWRAIVAETNRRRTS